MQTLLLALALLFATPAPSPAPTAVPAVTVHIRDFAFDPSALTVHTGDTVTFVNDDPATHDVSGGDLKSGPINPGKSWTHTFAKSGTYAFICSYHPSMKGTITVKE